VFEHSHEMPGKGAFQSMKINYTGINHLAMATGDIDATIAFWRDLLGMRLVAGMGRPGYRHYFFEISKHDMIAFFEWPGVEPLQEKDHGVPVRGPFAFDHISFEVAREDDLRQLKCLLEGAGQWVSEVIDHGFIHSIYTFDPNNIPIEFSWPVDTVDLRKRPCMADRDPSPLACEGSEPRPERWPRHENGCSDVKPPVYPGEGRILLDDDACGPTK
jgi:catechol 2,3-dioxygenase-like lactoylglutathione lyase family enzyme